MYKVLIHSFKVGRVLINLCCLILMIVALIINSSKILAALCIPLLISAYMDWFFNSLEEYLDFLERKNN